MPPTLRGVALRRKESGYAWQLRHVIKLRTDPAAEGEMREVFGRVREMVAKRWPALSGDLA